MPLSHHPCRVPLHQFWGVTTPSRGMYLLLHPFSASPGLVAMLSLERGAGWVLAGLCPFPGMKTALVVPGPVGVWAAPYTPCYFVPEPLSML